MNNKVIWIVGLAVVIGIGAYLTLGKTKTGNAPSNSNYAEGDVKNSKDSADQASKVSSLKDLLALGTSQKCNFSSEGSEGVFYISGGNSRGDFSSTVAGVTTKGHMMSDSKISYIWMDNQPKGFKMSLEAAQNAQANVEANPATASQGVDYNKPMDFKCESWTADSSMFVLPSDIEFMDMSAMIDNAKMMENQKMIKDAMEKAKQ